jgi:L,D-transpeptidase ErfK/SrfK
MLRRILSVLSFVTLVSSAHAAEYWIAEGDEVFGSVDVIEARHEDTFVALARTYNIGYEELRQANPGVDEWLPGEGAKITIPKLYVLPRAPQRGIVVNVAELRMYYFPANPGPLPEGVAPGSRKVITHPISVGRLDWSTPLGATTVTGKVANPSWYPPQSIRDEHAARNDILPRVVPAGPDNPLGNHALRLGLASYLIHGTNKPSGVGMRVTHGCIRMFPEDIEALFKTVPVGTTVTIVNQPVKIGWTADGRLYLESHPALKESSVDGESVAAVETTEPESPRPKIGEWSSIGMRPSAWLKPVAVFPRRFRRKLRRPSWRLRPSRHPPSTEPQSRGEKNRQRVAVHERKCGSEEPHFAYGSTYFDCDCSNMRSSLWLVASQQA